MVESKYIPSYTCPLLSLACDSWRNDTNVILADEMGLGKTVQSVSMLGFLQVTLMLLALMAL